MENNLGAPPTYNELFGAQPSVSQQPIYPTEPPPPYSSPVIEVCFVWLFIDKITSY